MGGGKDVNNSFQSFLTPQQQANINPALQDIGATYAQGPGAADFHGMAPVPLSGMTQNAAAGLGNYATGAGGQYAQAGQQYAQGALGQHRPDLAPGIQGAVGAIGDMAGGVNQLQQTASGAYLNPYSNPAFTAGRDLMRQEFQDSTLPGLDSAFSAAGRSGSGLKALQTGRAMEGLARAENELAGNVYQQERGRQDAAAGMLQQGGFQGMGQLGNYYGQVGADMRGAAGMLPGFNQMGLQNYQAGLAGGGVMDSFNERMRQFGIDEWAANNPYTRAQRLMALSQGQYGGTTHSSSEHQMGPMDWVNSIGGGVMTGFGTLKAIGDMF